MEQLEQINERLSSIEKMLLANKAVLSMTEVALYTGLSMSYLYKLTSTGGIPCYKPLGKHIYFKKDEIDQWLLSNRKTPSSEIEQQADTYITLNKRV